MGNSQKRKYAKSGRLGALINTYPEVGTFGSYAKYSGPRKVIAGEVVVFFVGPLEKVKNGWGDALAANQTDAFGLIISYHNTCFRSFD